jgi:hypothetical protein
MSWTYRVRKRTISATGVEFGIVEHYSLADADGWTENCITPVSLMELNGDAADDAKALDELLRWQLTEMLKALDKPVIEDKD